MHSLGSCRATVQECRAYISTITMRCFEVTKAAVNGYYQDSYFHVSPTETFSLQSQNSLRRLRAAIQLANKEFEETVRLKGAKFRIPQDWNKKQIQVNHENKPMMLSEDETFEWVRQALTRSRGKKPLGNYNPLVISELFLEQSTPWIEWSVEQIKRVTVMCSTFVSTLLQNECPEDITKRWTYTRLSAALITRHARAVYELQALMKDYHDHPMVYNHYYTDTVQKTRKA